MAFVVEFLCLCLGRISVRSLRLALMVCPWLSNLCLSLSLTFWVYFDDCLCRCVFVCLSAVVMYYFVVELQPRAFNCYILCVCRSFSIRHISVFFPDSLDVCDCKIFICVCL